MPVPFRDRLGKDFVISIGSIGCIELKPAEVWNELLAYLSDRAPQGIGRQTVDRLIVGSSDIGNLDSAGRFLLRRTYRDQASIGDTVLLIGCGNRIEVWAQEQYEIYVTNPTAYNSERMKLLQEAWSQMEQEP